MPNVEGGGDLRGEAWEVDTGGERPDDSDEAVGAERLLERLLEDDSDEAVGEIVDGACRFRFEFFKAFPILVYKDLTLSVVLSSSL